VSIEKIQVTQEARSVRDLLEEMFMCGQFVCRRREETYVRTPLDYHSPRSAKVSLVFLVITFVYGNLKKHGSEPLSRWDLTIPKEHDKYCEVIILSKSHYIVADCFGPPRYDPIPGGAFLPTRKITRMLLHLSCSPQNKPVKKWKVISLSVLESAEASCPKSSQPRKKVLRPVGNAKRGEGPNLSDAIVGSKGSIPCD
jgi:hypothetical protein